MKLRVADAAVGAHDAHEAWRARPRARSRPGARPRRSPGRGRSRPARGCASARARRPRCRARRRRSRCRTCFTGSPAAMRARGDLVAGRHLRAQAQAELGQLLAEAERLRARSARCRSRAGGSAATASGCGGIGSSWRARRTQPFAISSFSFRRSISAFSFGTRRGDVLLVVGTVEVHHRRVDLVAGGRELGAGGGDLEAPRAAASATAGSRPFGAPMPLGASTTTLKPASLQRRHVLERGVRCSPQVASRRSLPDFTCGAHELESASASTWPPSSVLQRRRAALVRDVVELRCRRPARTPPCRHGWRRRCRRCA